MDTDGKFWVLVWVVLAVVASIFASCITIYQIHKNGVLLEMIKDGASPIAANCALNDDYGKAPSCIILANDAKVQP